MVQSHYGREQESALRRDSRAALPQSERGRTPALTIRRHVVRSRETPSWPIGVANRFSRVGKKVPTITGLLMFGELHHLTVCVKAADVLVSNPAVPPYTAVI